ncbi:uncharacterized protein C8A04DRAFT_39157 [Dichotomopilus funicola]|uniref:Nephrocystin 3-like N-terminal domain-containing protein n=1 Tax=Dichotomopilus funicola TaxID=1934379 RepID=A0AAN6UY23_9PEZI|nr:hypothetical protein C8A04DRAFT_39157 [Dichotomopilus funicola]
MCQRWRTKFFELSQDSGLKRATERPGLARLASAVSDVHSQLFSPHSHQQSQDRTDDPLGLVVLHKPSKRTVDILFIHGLGGSSLRTWCRDGDLHKLWPKLWLPQLIPTARILSFGYKTHFSSKTDTSSLSIKNFAGDLLHQMKHGETTTERLGQVPIIIVAHSMGGLVFKKALVQGYETDEFADLVSMIRGVLFLATPHRGNRAEPRSRHLFHSVLGHSPMDYAMELTRGSPTIDDLSDLFRHHASTLQIFSFYETLAASRGLLSRMIIDKRTAVLGYHNETPVPLNADHHNVCKFTSRRDSNYISVMGAIRSIAESVSLRKDETLKPDLEHLGHLLGVTGISEEDLLRARSIRTQGTCEGFFTSEEVVAWLKSDASQILWLNAQPGGGKSIMCSFAIERLLEMGEDCSYYFFKHGERTKQSVSHMVRSIVYQTALQVPDYRSALAELGKAGVRLSNADASTVWERLVVKVFAKIKTTKPVYWVLDGLDESGSAGNFTSRLRILLARQAIEVVEMRLPDTQADVRQMVAKVIDNMPSGEEFKSKAIDEITSRSQGNFLWATSVTKRVVRCLNEDGIRQVLESTPDGMWGLYDRMTDVELSEILLIWAMYARTPILVQDLVELHAVYQVLDAESGNHELFRRCMATLCDMGLRRKLKMSNIPRFVSYAATSWATHLEHCSPEADDVLDSLVKFFSGPYPLAWIQYLAMTGQLSELFGISRRLSFGRPLSKSPTAIYHYIPALSPTSSIIHQSFSKNPISTLSVSGISNEEWNDCIARVSGGSGRALRLATSKLHLADWSLLASVSNPNQERAIELKFRDDDSLAMVSDSRRVYQLFPEEVAPSAAWVQMSPALLQEPEMFCSPSCVAFDANCAQMAMAYPSAPLSIWTVDPPRMIAQFNYKTKRGQGLMNSDTGNNKVVWHPSGTEVIGICGRVYKWNYATDEYSEIKDDTGAVPNGISCNGLRLYDLRGAYCHIWEPNCLLRIAGAEEEQTTDVDSIVADFWSDTVDIPRTPISLPASESQVESRPASTSIDCGRTLAGLLIAHANDDGSINIFDSVSNRKQEVDKAMPRRRDRLAYSVLDGGVVVLSVRLEYEDDRAVSTEILYAEKQASTQRGRTTQLLFDKSGSRLLICGVKMCQILSIPDRRVVAECQSPSAEEPTKWQQHPSRPDRLLRLSASLATTHSWDDLEPKDQIPLGLAGTVPDAVTDSADSPTVLDAILDSHSPHHLLLRTSTVRQNRRYYGFAILPTTSMYAETPTHSDSLPPTAIQPQPISPTVSEAAAHPLGILPDGRFLFLDRQLWVCTSLLSHFLGDPGLLSTKDAATITRHFFIPHDWTVVRIA